MLWDHKTSFDRIISTCIDLSLPQSAHSYISVQKRRPDNKPTRVDVGPIFSRRCDRRLYIGQMCSQGHRRGQVHNF